MYPLFKTPVMSTSIWLENVQERTRELRRSAPVDLAWKNVKNCAVGAVSLGQLPLNSFWSVSCQECCQFSYSVDDLSLIILTNKLPMKPFYINGADQGISMYFANSIYISSVDSNVTGNYDINNSRKCKAINWIKFVNLSICFLKFTLERNNGHMNLFTFFKLWDRFYWR